MAPLAAALMAGGTAMKISGSLRESKEAKKIANYRALIDIENAKAVETKAKEKARLLAEQGRKLMARQRAAAAAGNIRVDIGSPIVVEAQTRADLLKDIGLILDQGEIEKVAYLNRSRYEIETGKMMSKAGYWDAIASGISGFGSLAMLGVDQGWWGKKPVRNKVTEGEVTTA